MRWDLLKLDKVSLLGNSLFFLLLWILHKQKNNWDDRAALQKLSVVVDPRAVPVRSLAICQACSSTATTERGRLLGACTHVCVRGQTLPWQDPRDPVEGRVQPLKERLRARQSISGLHLHNKWSSHSFPRPQTHTHTRHSWAYPLGAHQHTPTQGRREERGGRGSVRETGRGQLSAGEVLHDD